ncbi:hypothetical protein BDW60DRAFT_201161 [Aspergillus nidulans var. acristatus]
MVTNGMACLSTSGILWLQPDPLRTMLNANEGEVGVNCTRRTRLLLMTLVVASIAGAYQRGAASPMMGVEKMTSLC